MPEDRPITGYPVPAAPRIPVASPIIGARESELVQEALAAGQVSGGAFVRRFEEGFAERIGVRHAVATMNGTVALHLALAALDLKPGDEVLVPDLTFIATANAVRYCGATPVLVDVDPLTWCMDPEAARAAITPRTVGMVPVHLYGYPAQMRELAALAEEAHLWLVEDAAEALGTTYRGRHVGALGHPAIFSFYGNKTLTTGEGGMVTTDDDRFAERLRSLRAHGMRPERRYWHEIVGFNYRMTNLQAALGVAQLERLDDMLVAKRATAHRYLKGLEGVDGLTLPGEPPEGAHGWWMFSLLYDSVKARDRVALALYEQGIETRPFFVPLHELPPYAGAAPCPVSADLGRRGMSLPTGAGLTPREVDEVSEAVKAAL